MIYEEGSGAAHFVDPVEFVSEMRVISVHALRETDPISKQSDRGLTEAT